MTNNNSNREFTVSRLQKRTAVHNNIRVNKLRYKKVSLYTRFENVNAGCRSQ
jgi:hypothetical protein